MRYLQPGALAMRGDRPDTAPSTPEYARNDFNSHLGTFLPISYSSPCCRILPLTTGVIPEGHPSVHPQDPVHRAAVQALSSVISRRLHVVMRDFHPGQPSVDPLCQR